MNKSEYTDKELIEAIHSTKEWKKEAIVEINKILEERSIPVNKLKTLATEVLANKIDKDLCSSKFFSDSNSIIYKSSFLTETEIKAIFKKRFTIYREKKDTLNYGLDSLG